MSKLGRFLLLFGLVFCFSRADQAQTIKAASCSAADVQTAFNAVVASTTTVTVPTCSGGVGWATQDTLTVPSGSTSFTLQGQTTITGNCTPSSPTCTANDQTVIIDNYNSNSGILGITINSTNCALVRITGFTIEGGSGIVKDQGMMGIGGNCPNIRLDHNHFDTSTYSPSNQSTTIRYSGCTFGVIDHNIFNNPSGQVNNSVQADNGGTCYGDSLGVGDQEWAHTTGLGTANSLYMENNTFNNGASNDCTFGGRFVERYNVFNMSAPPPAVQTHPTGGAGRIRGCRAWEIYGNAYDAASDQFINTAFFASAGTGVVWNNTIPSSGAGGGTGYKIFLELHSMRRDNTTYGEVATPDGWGYCGTSFNGTGSNWDQNSNTSTGYRCLDTVGNGIGDFLTGGFSYDGSGSNNVTNNATGCVASQSCAWPRQALEPMYEWMDNFSCVPSNPCAFESNFDAGSYTNNVDYYLWCNASSNSGCTSFNGTVGVGSGLLSGRPSTCTMGVGYWATDTSTLYQCAATNTWTTFYTPYTYPHPLEGGAPVAPTGLMGTVQ